MFSPTLQVGPMTFSTYTTSVVLALLFGAGFVLYRTAPEARLVVFDVLIGVDWRADSGAH